MFPSFWTGCRDSNAYRQQEQTRAHQRNNPKTGYRGKRQHHNRTYGNLE